MSKMTPMMARTEKQIRSLKPDSNVSIAGTGFVIEPDIVYFGKPSSEDIFEIDRRVFDWIIRWYVTGDPDKEIKLEADDE